MKKKLITYAVAAAIFAPLTAQAGTTLYGRLDISANAWDTQTSSAANGSFPGANFNLRGLNMMRGNNVDMLSNDSVVGLKGSEALGNGLQAIYKVEWGIDPTCTFGASNNGSCQNTPGSNNGSVNGSVYGREQWLGLQSASFGSVTFGTVLTPYAYTGSLVDPMYNTALQARNFGMESALQNDMSGEDGQAFANKSLRFTSAKIMGFQVLGHYTLHTNQAAGISGHDTWSAGLLYDQGPVLAYGNYMTNGAGGKDRAYKFGAKIDLSSFVSGMAVYGQWERDGGLISRSFGVSASGALVAPASALAQNNLNVNGGDTWFTGASYGLGNATLVAEYGQGNDSRNAGGVDVGNNTKTYLVGAKYAFGQRTFAYGGWARVASNNEALSGIKHIDTITVGMQHSF
ncbi:MAG TPA: porin [Gammaproteobacteria bacterium]|nr:porin [Gammaproteobacteria bacterium]